MWVWLDDIRPMPESFTVHVKTAKEAIELLKTNQVTLISLDHDLGEYLTGYDVAKYIERAASSGTLKRLTVAVHTANPVGRVKMCQALENAKKFWSILEENDLTSDE